MRHGRRVLKHTVPVTATHKPPPPSDSLLTPKARDAKYNRAAEKLSDASVKGATLPKASKARKLSDGGGLVMMITRRANGALRRAWWFRYRIKVASAGAVSLRETTHTIGEYPEWSLKAARDECKRLRKIIETGQSPSQARTALEDQHASARANTFRAAADEWLKGLAVTDRTRIQRTNALSRHVPAEMQDRPINTVTQPMISGLLAGVFKSKGKGKGGPQMAKLLELCLNGIFANAVENGSIALEKDPLALHKRVQKNRRKLVPKEAKHHEALAVDAIGPYLRAVANATGDAQTRAAVRLAFYTLARSVEVIGARWVEFDLDGALWTIPAERMKMGKPHRVPLPTQAVALLRGLKATGGGSPYIFPNRTDPRKPASRGVLWKMSARLAGKGRDGGPFTPHGIRSTGSTHLNTKAVSGQAYSPDWIERQLAHVDRNKVRAAYNQNEYIEERREMMQAWADWLHLQEHGPESAQSISNVIDLPKRRGVK